MVHLSAGKVEAEKPATTLSAWHSLQGLDEKGLIVQHFESRQNPDRVRYLHYDLYTDQLNGETTPSTDDSIEAPIIFRAGSPGFDTFIRLLGHRAVLACEYLEHGDTIIVSYYVQESDRFDRHLLVLKNGEEVYHQLQDAEMQGFAPGSFFTYQNHLIFVRHTHELNLYEI